MIKQLDGIHETVAYRTDTQICLYYNTVCEDYPTHWHTSFEVIMPAIGTYRVVCGGQEYFLREGDILIICPCMLHALYASEQGERIIFQPGISHINIKELQQLIFAIRPALLLTPEDFPEIYADAKRLMLEIKEEYFSASLYSEIAILSKFLEILVDTGRSCTALSGKSKESGKIFQKEYIEKFLYLTDYISRHFAENLSLEEMASLAGFSKYHFSRLFKQYTDTSFYRYLNQKRIDHAKTLLLDPKISVTEVALQSGFSSLSAFLRMFKQMTLCTPTEFRNLYSG